MDSLTKWSTRLGRLLPGAASKPALLGESLVAEGLITAEQLEEALEAQERKGFRVGYHLVKMGAIDETTLGDHLAARQGIPALPNHAIHLDANLLKDIPHRTMREHEVFPIHRTENSITLVMADPTDHEVIAELSQDIGVRINPVVAPQSVIKKHLSDYFALEEIRNKSGGGEATEELSHFFTHLPDYRFQKVLGVGGFGMVCRCWQVSLDRAVAIKTMNRKVSQIEGMSDRFEREGKIIAKLRHPNIIQIFELGEVFGNMYIVMEYFEGDPIDEYCRGRDLVEKIGCLIPLCDALYFACTQGVVHRDVKPANMLVNAAGDVKLLDFGVSYFHQVGDERLTVQNMVLGTPKYMAPECFDSAMETSTVSDVYAMGVMAYELITGKEFDKTKPVPPNQIDINIPNLLSQTLLKATTGDRDDRLRSFDLFKKSLMLSRDHIMMGKTIISTPGEARPENQTDLAASETPSSSKGSMGQCYEEIEVLRDDGRDDRVVVARHRQMERKVVIKQIPKRQVEENILLRLAEIKHPAIGQTLGSAAGPGHVTLVMEYLEGGSLADRMRAGPLAPRDCAVWFEATVAALHTAAQRGVSHGRLHPGNILFTSDGRLKVVDFSLGGERSMQFARFSRPDIQDPWEQDRYALGVMWFEMLQAERFRGAQSAEKNFVKVQNNKNIEPCLRVPLGRLWGIQRYGRKYKGYSDMLPDLKMVREKLCPKPDESLVGAHDGAPAPVARKTQLAKKNLWLWAGAAVASAIVIGVLFFLTK